MADEIIIETTSQEVIEVGVPGPQGATGPQGPAGAAGASAWNDITGKPATFAPSAHASTHHTGGSDPITPANIGAAKAVGIMELTPNGTTTITTSQLPARGIAFVEGGGNFTVNLPTPGLRESGLWFSIKTEHEGIERGDVFITVVHNAVNLLTAFDLTQDEGSIDFLWDGYEWTYSSKYYIASTPVRELLLPNASGIIARTSDIPSTFAASAITSGVLDNARVNFAAPPAIGAQTPNTGAFTNLSAASRLNLPSASGNSANDIWVSGGQLRYQSGSLITSARTLLNAEDNLSNLANAATARTNIALGSADSVTFGSIQNTPIGSTTASTGAFTTLSANNGTLTASAPVLDLSQTWNNAAVTFTGLRINVTNTASNSASNIIDIQVGGTTRMMLKRDGVLHLGPFTNSGFYSPAPAWHGSTAGLVAATNLAIGSSLDTILERGGAGIIEQRNLANAQTYRIYNTYTDANNHERGFMRWSSNVLQIGTEKAGTGSARALEFQTDGTSRLTISTAGVFQFGGTTSSFPALKRSSTTLQVRLADDSAFAAFECAGLTLNGNLTVSTRNIVTDTTTGTRIGTGTTQKIGFFNATPVVQQAAIADATDAATTQARLNDLLATMRTLGLIAT